MPACRAQLARDQDAKRASAGEGDAHRFALSVSAARDWRKIEARVCAGICAALVLLEARQVGADGVALVVLAGLALGALGALSVAEQGQLGDVGVKAGSQE